jgi:hypothetical protein
MSEAESQTASPPPAWLKWLVPGWTAGMIALFAASGWYLISETHQARLEAQARHRERIEASDTSHGGPSADGTDWSSVTKVKVGCYLDRIIGLSVREAGWTADFFVWFVWKGDKVNPPETMQVVDGEIEQKEKVRVETLPDGQTYALYRVRARITKFFSVARFPADDHLLTLRLEDGAHDQNRVQFVPDADNSGISSRVSVSGYVIGPVSVIVKPHAYKTTQGDPRLPKGYQATYSQLIYAIAIKRGDAGFYVKVFQGLFAAVAIAFIVFFIKPTDVDPRFGLGVGSFFAAIANCYITAQLIPDTGQLSLADKVNGFAIITIFLTLVQSTVSLYVFDILGQEALSRKFDKVSAVIMVPAYALINYLLYRAAVG